MIFRISRDRLLAKPSCIILLTSIVFLDCGSNISNTDSGKVQSPNFPLKYTAPEKGMPSRTCNWFINVRPNYKILLNFVSFSVEGDPLSMY